MSDWRDLEKMDEIYRALMWIGVAIFTGLCIVAMAIFRAGGCGA